MKRQSYKFLIGVVLLVAVVVVFKPAVLALTQNVLKQQFSLNAVSIRNIEFKNFGAICLKDVNIQKAASFSLEAQEISLRVSLLDREKRKKFKIVVESAVLQIKRPNQTFMSYMRRNVSQKSSRVMLSAVEFSDFGLNVEFKDLKIDGKFSADVDLTQQTVNSLHLNISSLKYQALNLENVLLWATRNNNRGEFSAVKILYDKVEVTEMNSLVRFDNKDLIFYDVSAKVFDGNISGDYVLTLAVVSEYQVRLQFKDLDISRFVEDFELKNKFVMTGKANGNIQLQGQGVVVKVLGGEFTTDKVGGRLIIKDVSFLDKIPYRSSVEGLVGSVQDYQYDTGFVKVSLQDQDLLADIHLDGKQGKRDFNIVIHQ